MNLPVDALSLSDYSADMKKTVVPAKAQNPQGNGFATKDDIKKLRESFHERFDRFEHRFEWFKDDWDWWKKDTFRLFEHRWQQLIDPVLKEIVDMRESYEIEMGRSAENRERLGAIGGKVEKLDGRMEKIENRMGKVENKIDSMEITIGSMGTTINSMGTTIGSMGITLGKIAKKVGA